jgi:ferritin-like metal-binding protein YciE
MPYVNGLNDTRHSSFTGVAGKFDHKTKVMNASNKNIATLQHLLDYDARKFVSAEVQLKINLSTWINGAGSLKLKTVLQKYLDYVSEHIQQMEKFIEDENISSLDIVNRIMRAYLDETNEKLNNCADPEIKDAGLLSSIQGINHFKINMYGTAAAFAKAIGMEKYAGIFHEAEQNEKQIDERLSQLANSEINVHANAPFAIKG